MSSAGSPNPTLPKFKISKYAKEYWVKYESPITGKLRHVSKKYTGTLANRADAEAWVKDNLANVIASECAMLERQAWRKSVFIVKVANEYAAFKKRLAPRSAQQEISILNNFVLPFFVTQQGLNDPNEWFRQHQKFKSWLLAASDGDDEEGEAQDKLEGARTDKGDPITVSTANKAINALNKFSE